jgi:hypothetical protein
MPLMSLPLLMQVVALVRPSAHMENHSSENLVDKKNEKFPENRLKP